MSKISSEDRYLDSLLMKYVNQRYPEETPDSGKLNIISEEPISYIIEEVSKRFDFKETSKNPAKNIPKRKFIPFYSHSADVFSDLEKNSILFEEGKDPEEESIGILSKLNNSRYNINKLYPTDDAILAIDTEKSIYQNIARDWFHYIEEIIATINPYEMITVNKKKNPDGNMTAVISLGVCSGYRVQCLQKKLSQTINQKYFSGVAITPYLDDIRDFAQLLGVYSDAVVKNIAKTFEKMCENVLYTIVFQREFDSTDIMQIFKKLAFKSNKLSRTEFDRLYSELQDRIFEFSHDFIFAAKNLPNYNFHEEVINGGFRIPKEESELLTKYPQIIEEASIFKGKVQSIMEDTFINERNHIIKKEKSKGVDECYYNPFKDPYFKEGKDSSSKNAISIIPKRNFRTERPTWK